MVTELERDFPGSKHVRDFGLERADDALIWQLAQDQGFVILSKDADFHQMSFLHGHPPRVVWLRLGNRSTDEILAAIRRHRDSLAHFEASEDASFLTLS